MCSALLYSVFGVTIEKARGAEDHLNTIAAGTLTGVLYKSPGRSYAYHSVLSESALFLKEFVVVFKKLLVHTRIHTYLTWKQKHLKRLNNNTNVYETGTEDLCTLYIQLYRKYAYVFT